MKLQCPIPKILLPVDGSKHSKKAVQFAGCLGRAIGKSLSGITLLRVLTGGYLSRHMVNIDFRTKVLVKESDVFKRIRQVHINQNINPFLDESEKILRDSGIEATIERLILDGDTANEIIRTADEGSFSAIIMARRGLSELKWIFVGSVTSKVIHAATKQTVYIVGKKTSKPKTCPIPKILIPVDGSAYSLKGVEHVACLTYPFKESLDRITLLRVVNVALYMERLKGGIDPEIEANQILSDAEKIFVDSGFSEGLIETAIAIGKPAEEILKKADEGEYNLIVMGRKGRTAFKDIVIGGVSSTVLQRCQNQTVAIVSSK
ncbi:MAG: universal stress protein [Nitrospirae bacterium]|nr:universal stress protein [Nitrospirota bacterium]